MSLEGAFLSEHLVECGIQLKAKVVNSDYRLTPISFALRQLEALTGRYRASPDAQTNLLISSPTRTQRASNPPLQIRRIQPLPNRALTAYLRQRGISTATAKPDVQEIDSTRNGQNDFARAFENERGGYERRTPYFKGVHGTKDLSILKKKEVRVKKQGKERKW